MGHKTINKLSMNTIMSRNCFKLNSLLSNSMFAKLRIPKRSFASAMNSDGYTLNEQYNWAMNAQILAKYTKSLSPSSTPAVAYLGAFSDYYIKNTDFEVQDDLDEIYVLDSDPKLLQQYHSDMSDVLKNKEKWFLHYDSSNFILEPNSTDMVVINDRVCCKYTPNIPRTIIQVVKIALTTFSQLFMSMTLKLKSMKTAKIKS